MLASDERDIPGARCVEYHAAEPAGSGGSLLDDSTRIGCIPFRRAWLDRLGLDATQCALVRMRGESMEPTLTDGSTILIHIDFDISTIRPPVLQPACASTPGWIQIGAHKVHFNEGSQSGFESIRDGITSWQEANGVG